MSSNVPPPYEPGPAAGQPEFLGPEPTPPATSSPRGRRNALIAGSVVGGLAVIGGGAWAASWYLGSGPSAAEVLPAETVAFAQVNLDPSGEQKVAALDMLNKFPAFKEMGVGSTDDLREKLWTEVQNAGTCPDLDYSDDIEPWLGDRVAIAAVDTGADQPVPVLVVEVSDEGEAADGLDALDVCAADDPEGESSGYVISDGWAYVSASEDDAQSVVDALDDGSLADDTTYTRMSDAAGADGVVTAYAAPSAADYLGTLADAQDSGLTDSDNAELDAVLKDFGGMALKVRFADSGLEAEYAGDASLGGTKEALSEDGAKAVTDLPDDTAIAFGLAVKPGWIDVLVKGFAAGYGSTPEQLYAQIESATGLSMPEDAETLLGDSFALAVSSDLDIEAAINNEDLSSLPVGMKVVGDADGIEDVLDRIRTASGPTASRFLQSTADGDSVGFGPSEEWNQTLAADGSLGDSDTFRGVVPDADRAASIYYIDFDAADEWLAEALSSSGAGDDVVDNVKPIKALGASGWIDGDLVHGRVSITTD